MRIVSLTLALSALLLALPHPAPAQWTNDPWNGMVSVCDAPDDQEYIRTCALDNGHTFIGWLDQRSDTTKLYYQILNSSGLELLETNGRVVFEGGGASGWGGPSGKGVVPDGEGGCIVVATDNRSGNVDIYGQRFDPWGNRLWGEDGLPLVVCPMFEEAGLKDVAYDSMGNFYIGWVGEVSNYDTDLYAQKFNADGQRLWGDYGVPASIEHWHQGWPQIVPDMAGGLLLAWEDDRDVLNEDYIYAQHLDADGNPLWEENGIQVFYPSGIAMQVLALSEGVPDGQGGGIWVKTVLGPDSWLDVFRLSGENGRTLWRFRPNYFCVHGVTDMIRHPVDGTIWLTVSEVRHGYFEKYLYRLDVRGFPYFGDGRPIGGRRLAPTSDGVITTEYYFESPDTRLIAHRVDSAGTVVWISDVALSDVTTPGGGPVFVDPEAVTDGQDGAVIAFTDYRNISVTGYDISAQRVLLDGTLGSPVYTPPPVQYHPGELNWGIIGGSIHFQLPISGQVNLSLFDLLGRRVATLGEGYRQAGTYAIPFSNIGLSSGIYLVRLASPAGQQVKRMVVIQ